MNAHELLDDTVEHYKTHPRAMVARGNRRFSCQYLTPTGEMCAIGRWLNPKSEDYEQIVRENGSATFIFQQFMKEVEDPKSLFKEEVHELLGDEYLGFWVGLQRLHDVHENWELNPETEGNRLTKQGEDSVEYVRRMIPVSPTYVEKGVIQNAQQ